MRRVFVVIVALMVFPGVARAGGGGVDTSGCAGFSEGTTVSMQDSCFAGTAHFAPGGAAIIISNDGALPHTFTAVDGSFDTGQVAPGESTDVTISEPGIYRIFCTLHGTAAGEGMAGVVVVGDAAPPSVALPASIDTGPVAEVVAEENQRIAEAMDRQGRSMGEIRAEQRQVADALDDLTEAIAAESGRSAAVTPITVESNSENVVLSIAVGVAAGLALAALLTVLWRRKSAEAEALPEGLRPSVEA